jgi:hypothetical protein
MNTGTGPETCQTGVSLAPTFSRQNPDLFKAKYDGIAFAGMIKFFGWRGMIADGGAFCQTARNFGQLARRPA